MATVVPYYHRFLAEFPDVNSLAAAEEQQVLRCWEGLGYYRRARQMHAAAQRIAGEHAGRFPTTYDAVHSLPGIGRYTAGAILSIGLDSRLPILEANTIRVLSRLSAYRGEVTAAAGQRHLWSLAEMLLPARDCGAFNQALMELGSEICAPRTPACGVCPVAVHCRAYADRLVDQVPAPAKRTRYEEVTEIAVIVRDGRRVLVRQCQPGERWAGLWDFPRYAGDAAAAPQRVAELTGAKISLGQHLTTLKHGVTRFRITLDCYEATCIDCAEPDCKYAEANLEVRWVRPGDLVKLPLSVTGRKLAQLLMPRSAATAPSTPRPSAARTGRSRRKTGRAKSRDPLR